MQSTSSWCWNLWTEIVARWQRTQRSLPRNYRISVENSIALWGKGFALFALSSKEMDASPSGQVAPLDLSIVQATVTSQNLVGLRREPNLAKVTSIVRCLRRIFPRECLVRILHLSSGLRPRTTVVPLMEKPAPKAQDFVCQLSTADRRSKDVAVKNWLIGRRIFSVSVINGFVLDVEFVAVQSRRNAQEQ